MAALHRLLLLAVVSLAVLMLGGCDVPDASGPSTPAQVPAALSPAASSDSGAVAGQSYLVYVPVYSHIYHQDGSREFNLTATLSIRNTDPEHAITVAEVRYYDSAGGLIRSYLDEPLQLPPLSSTPFVVEERDKAGGVGANFLVEWRPTAEVSPPVIEAVMISTAGTQGISFVTRGQVVRPLPE